ncbi:hypothetical protein F4861DRAFT_512488 [Xylaria intraflava]|nr:hypothetical protein F4861DRAFT_512488 [Xylaria intraflava]
MADIYTPPPDSSYLFFSPFYMPTDSGSIWAVACSNNSGTIITAAISVVFTVIFVSLWNLICFIAMLFPGKHWRRRRLVALVALWNSNDAWFAFRELSSYAAHYFKRSTKDFVYGLTLATLALIVYGGSLALGIVGPTLVQVGNVAPVRPSSVYYPSTPKENDYPGLLKEFGLRAPSVLRALGSVEAAMVTTRSKVNLYENTNYGVWKNGEPIHLFKYNYSLTGIDLGLQQGAGLELTVEGSCITEYGWISDNSSTKKDSYNLWGMESQRFDVPIDPYNIQSAPKASFMSHPDADNQIRNDGNSSFAVVVWSAHRASISEGSDPWYATEPRNSTVQAFYNAQFWMKRSRPVLSCWQQDRWRYGSFAVKSILELNNIPGSKIPRVLLNVLRAALTTPVLARIGNASGDSALRSRTTSPNGVINAGASSIHDDIERLLVASYVGTRNVFVDSTMFQTDGSWKNLVLGDNGRPSAGAGNFVVASPNIQTFSLVGIIVLLVVLAVLLLLQLFLNRAIHRHEQPRTQQPSAQPSDDSEQQGTNGSANPITTGDPRNPVDIHNSEPTSPWILFKALAATQLFRRIYETEEGTEDKNWSCASHFPSHDDKYIFKTVNCQQNRSDDGQRGLPRCKGHICSCAPVSPTAPVPPVSPTNPVAGQAENSTGALVPYVPSSPRSRYSAPYVRTTS